jgi:hypothetical protein
MNRKLSQRLLVAEAVVLALPLTALMAVGLTTVSPDAIDEFWPWLAVCGVSRCGLVAHRQSRSRRSGSLAQHESCLVDYSIAGLDTRPCLSSEHSSSALVRVLADSILS